MLNLTLPRQFPVLCTALLTLSACSENLQKTENKPISPTISTSQTQGIPQGLGRRIFTRCRACHTLNEGGRHKVGPNLWKIIGRKAGSAEEYAYSKAMITSNIIWTEETISAYLENPAIFMPKNKMSFVGIRKRSERDAVIVYIKANTGSK